VIEMNFEEFSIFIISMSILLLVLLLGLHALKERRFRRRRYYQVVQCPVCGEVFDDRSSEKFPECKGGGPSKCLHVGIHFRYQACTIVKIFDNPRRQFSY